MSAKMGVSNKPIVVGSCGHAHSDKLVDKSRLYEPTIIWIFFNFPSSTFLIFSRWSEFEKLAAEANSPCEGAHSGEWSCVRWASPAEIAKRVPTEYGFHKDDAPWGEQVNYLYTL
jgi:hypothetical protein